MVFKFRRFKIGLLAAFIALTGLWLLGGKSIPASSVATSEKTEIGLPQDKYVGSETCAACHQPQFDKVARTKHGKLHTLSSWKGKVVGCESCHGPGRDHVDGGGDKTKIIILKNLDPKAASETCLACHAGKESHNNFRRGEHWRNNIGCSECHAAHGPELPKMKLGSSTLVSDASAQNPGQAERALLRSTSPSLCLSCHSEIKAQFSKPFRHKVLEGTINCTDCHNPHGGFESKQTRLAVAADAVCIKCHANKQGPFVYEHGPLKLEGCTACHTPHGSSNPKMLKRSQIRQLCFECHTGITGELAEQAPTHNQATLRYQQCTVCHSAIHGSNSSRLFFR